MRFVLLLLAVCLQAGMGAAPEDKAFTFDAKTGTYHVHPKSRIQEALEAAAADPVNDTVSVHAGASRSMTVPCSRCNREAFTLFGLERWP